MDDALIYRNEGNPLLLELLPRTPGHIVDCGCGPGDNAKLLQARGWAVTGITLDAREREVALACCDEIYLADLENGLPDGLRDPLDAVLMSHVLEHLVRPERLLADVRKRLASSGVIAVALPNVLHYNQRIRFMRGDFTYTETGILDRTHVRFYTYTTGRKLLEDNGFAIVAAVPDGSLPFWRLRGVIPKVVIRQTTDWAVRRKPNLFAHQSLFLARPARSA